MRICNKPENVPNLPPVAGDASTLPDSDTGLPTASGIPQVFNDGMRQAMTRELVPIHQKLALSIREAAAYSNIGINKIEELARDPGCPFVLRVGTRKLIKRKEFEDYISRKYII